MSPRDEVNHLLARVRVIFFDAVGTLLHPEPPAAVAYAEAGRRHGSRLALDEIAARFAAAFQRQEQLDRAGGLRTSEAREVERWRTIVAAVLDDVTDPEACFQELFEHFARPASWRCEPGTAEVLQTLRDCHYTLGLASNYDSRLRRVVAGRPELTPLAHLVISSEVGWRKPAREFFDALASAAGCYPGDVLCIGDDRVNDYNGPRDAGMWAMLFDPHGKAPESTWRIGRLLDLISE